jgi:hypothetical protein
MRGIRIAYGVMTIGLRVLLAVLVNLATLPKAYADAPTSPVGTGSTASIATQLEPATKAVEFSGHLVFDTARSLDPSVATSWSGQYTATLGFKHARTGITAEAEVSYAREYSYQRDDGMDGDLHHALLLVGKNWESGKDFDTKMIDHVGVNFSGLLPVNREMQRRTFRGSAGPGVGVDKAFGRFTLAQAVGYRRASYEYDIRDDGTVNIPDVVKLKSDLSFAFNDQWSFGIDYVYTYAVSFQGVARGADTIVYELDYQPWKTLGFALGLLSDRATTLDPDGQSSQASLYSQEGASGYFDLILSF